MQRYINNLPSTRKKQKHENIDLGNHIAKFMANDSSLKIESQVWSGLDNTRDNQLKDFLYRTDFKTERIAAGVDLSQHGKVVPVLIPDGETWTLEFLILASATIVKRKIILNEKTKFLGVKIPKYNSDGAVIEDNSTMEWTMENGRVVLRIFEHNLKNYKEEKKEVSKIIYPASIDFFPGSLIRNNAKAMPDFMKVIDILIEINTLSNDLGPELEKVKTLFASNANFGTGKKGSGLEEEIINGKSVLDVFSTNSKFGSELNAIMSGSTTPSLFIQQIAFLEDRAMKYAHQGRDMDSNSNNKHNMQVGIFNQAHGEYILDKIEQRQRDFEYFFKEIFSPITKIKAPKKITINNSIFEQGKIEGMKSIMNQTNLYNAQAKAQSAMANKHNAEAEGKNKETELLGKEIPKSNNTENQ